MHTCKTHTLPSFEQTVSRVHTHRQTYRHVYTKQFVSTYWSSNKIQYWGKSIIICLFTVFPLSLCSGKTRGKTVKHCSQRGVSAISSLAFTAVRQAISFCGNLEQQGKQVNNTRYWDMQRSKHTGIKACVGGVRVVILSLSSGKAFATRAAVSFYPSLKWWEKIWAGVWR